MMALKRMFSMCNFLDCIKGATIWDHIDKCRPSNDSVTPSSD